ncbi:MAG: DUF4336 domain-containing protein [Oligoflexus sp.]
MVQAKQESILRELKPGVWVAEGEVRMPGAVTLPTRMTVLRLKDGNLLVHSPIKIQEDLAQAVAEKGAVRFLLAPNAFHHIFLKSWQRRFPDALTFGPQALQKKRPDLHFDRYLDLDSDNPWGEDIVMEVVGGIPKVQEVVVYHRPSQTLVLSDLVFNIRNAHGRLKWILKIMGTYHKLSMSRLIRLLIKDDVAFSRSLSRILELPFNLVIMAHGNILSGQDCDEVRKLMQARSKTGD